MLDALLEPLSIHLEYIGNLPNPSRRESLLVNVDVAVVRTSIGSIHVKVYCNSSSALAKYAVTL